MYMGVGNCTRPRIQDNQQRTEASSCRTSLLLDGGISVVASLAVLAGILAEIVQKLKFLNNSIGKNRNMNKRAIHEPAQYSDLHRQALLIYHLKHVSTGA
jgi:hypothetical protein